VELRLDLPVGHDTIPFEDIQGFVRLAELGGAAPSDPVIGINPDTHLNPEGDHDTASGPQTLCIEVHTPAEWTPYINIDKRLGLRTLRLLLSLRDRTWHTASDADAGDDAGGDAGGDAEKNHRAELVEITNELLRALTE
jgi:hypothetical protein